MHNDIVTLIPQRLEKELAEAKEHRRPPMQTYAPLPKWHDGNPSQWHDGIQGGIKEISGGGMGEYMKTSPESPVGPAQKINMIHIARGMVQGALVPLAQERGEGRVTVRSNRPPSDPCNSSPLPHTEPTPTRQTTKAHRHIMTTTKWPNPAN